MADGGFASQFLPALSHLLGEVEQPTNTQSMMNPQFGGSPEQLQGILQHPETQQLMQRLGIHFDPSQIRQSPFLPNSIMQAHPLFGKALTGALASAAATPEAPLVSGAGSGITRAAQGMMGGPEILRQYGVRQMLAPMQAMGSMIPGQEFQRKQQLLQLLQQMEQDRAAAAERHEQYTEQSPAGRLQNEIYAPPSAPGYFTREAPQPAGGASGADLAPAHGQGRMLPSLSPGAVGQQFQAPDWGLASATPGGPLYHPYDPNAVLALHPERVGAGAYSQARAGEVSAEQAAGKPGAVVADIRAQAGQRTAQGNLDTAKIPTEKSKQEELEAKAKKEQADAALPGGRWQASHLEQMSRQYDQAQMDTTKQIQAIQQRAALAPTDRDYIAPELAQQQINDLRANLEVMKRNIDNARNAYGASGSYKAPPGASSDLPIVGGKRNPALSPGANKPKTEQQGSDKGGGTAVAPPSQGGGGGIPGHPDYYMDENGIPRPVQQRQQ